MSLAATIVAEASAFLNCFIENLIEWIFTAGLVSCAVFLGVVVEPKSDRAVFENFNERYPYSGETIGIPILFALIIVLPCAVLSLFALVCPGKIHLCFLYMSLAQVLAITLLVTETLKIAVARPRPNYFAYCKYDQGSRECTGPAAAQKDARVSFPSGHASNAFACGTWITLCIRQLAPAAPELWWLLVQLAPLFAATYIASTRITDYMHHVSDVVGGAVLGIGIAVVVFQAQSGRMFVQAQRKGQYVGLAPL
jgi:membrane-associated phospholipid phosphatase